MTETKTLQERLDIAMVHTDFSEDERLYPSLPDDYCIVKVQGETQRKSELARGLTIGDAVKFQGDGRNCHRGKNEKTR